MPIPTIRRDEVRIDRECLLVHFDRFVEPAHLHQQLGVRVIRIGIVRQQLDVLLECRLGVGISLQKAIRITQLVIGSREIRIRLRRTNVVLDGGLVLLPAEIDNAEQREDALVVRIQPDGLVVMLQDGGRIASQAGIAGENDLTLAFADAARQGDGTLGRIDELSGRARCRGESQVRKREFRILCHRFGIEPARVGDPQLVGKIAPLQIQLPRLVRRCRDRHFCRAGCLRARNGRASAGRDENHACQCSCYESLVVHRSLPGNDRPYADCRRTASALVRTTPAKGPTAARRGEC